MLKSIRMGLASTVSRWFGRGGDVKVAGPPETSGYQPMNQGWFIQPRELPPFTWWTARQMLFDPTIRLGLLMRAAPIVSTQWAYKTTGSDEWTEGIQADNDQVAAYVLRQLKTIWQFLDAILTAQVYGWSAAEVCCRLNERSRLVELSELLPRQSTDTRALVHGGKVAGVRFLRIQHAKNGYVDLGFPRAFFHAHQPEAGHTYGSSILLGAYSPWADKWLNGGALDVRRLFMHADAYGGKDVRYPEGVTRINGVDIPHRDMARQIAEQLTSGGVTFMPSDVDPVTKQPKWSIERATVPANPAHILQYPKDCDTEMLRGLGIPDDVLESTDGAGGAWAGKRVPQAAFYSGLEFWRIGLIREIKCQILEPMVELNFGPGRWFEVTAKPMAEQAMEQQGTGPQGGSRPSAFPSMGDRDGGFFEWMNRHGGGGDGHASNGQPQRMSLDPVEAVGCGVLDAAELVTAANRVIRMRTGGDDVPAGARWVTIGGRKGNDGERKGGFPVLIDGDGRILRSGGPKGLVGKPVSKAGEHLQQEAGESRRANVREADAADPVGKSRSYSKIVAHQASKWGIDPDTYEGIAQEVWEDRLAIHEDREAAKARARQALGLSAGDIKRLEEQGFDYGSVRKRIKGFDTMGRTLADSFPSLGWGTGYGADAGRNYDELLWNLIKEGKQDAPSRISKEFHEEVDAYLQSELDRHKGRKKELPRESEWDAVEFSLSRPPAVRMQTLSPVNSAAFLNGSGPAEPLPVERAEFSCAMFYLPDELVSHVFDLQRRIHADDLAEKGIEIEPHVTVKYGLHTDIADDVRVAIADKSPVAIQFGEASAFEGPEYDVVKIEVESKGLHALTAAIAEALPHTDTHPDYRPHVTIAYVKPGLGKFYAERLNDLKGRTAVFDRLVFSDRSRKHTWIPLTSKATRFGLATATST